MFLKWFCFRERDRISEREKVLNMARSAVTEKLMLISLPVRKEMIKSSFNRFMAPTALFSKGSVNLESISEIKCQPCLSGLADLFLLEEQYGDAPLRKVNGTAKPCRPAAKYDHVKIFRRHEDLLSQIYPR